MAISFDNIPTTIRVPFMGVEISSENAVQGVVVQPYRVLLIGQRLTAGTVAAHVATRVTSAAQARKFFGAGSMLAQMCAAFLQNNNFTEMHAIAVDDDSAGVAASGKVEFTGPATAAGTLYLYVGGRRLTVGIGSGDTADDIAAAVATAINAHADLPVTAAASTGEVTLTARHKGTVGNKIDVRVNYYDGEETPAGVGVSITPMSGGTSDPDLSDAIAALGDVQYNVVGHPYTSANNLTAIENELADRWGPMRQIEGVSITADNGNHSALGTLGGSRNSPFSSIIPAYGSPTPVWEVAAMVAGLVAYYSNIDPARQFKTLEVKGMLAPATADRFTLEERNLLLYDGISALSVDAGGKVRVERIITTYKQNPAGADDPSYLDIMTVLLLGFIRYDWRNHILRKYPRHKLANDGTRIGAGQAVITPKVGMAEALVKFRQWEELGYVEGFEQFKRDSYCERNPTDPNRLDWYLAPDLVNNFMVGGTKIGFLLQAVSLES